MKKGAGDLFPYLGILRPLRSQYSPSVCKNRNAAQARSRLETTLSRKKSPGPLFVAAIALSCVPLVAHAQEAPSLRAHHFTIGAGLLWSGAYDIGDATAQLRGNGSGTPPPFTLLTAESRVTSAVAPEFRVGFAATPRVALEFGVAVTRPHIGVAIAADPEAPAQQLLGERLEQYLIGGGVTWQLPIRMGARLAPFVSGGATFLRQLHEDRALAETGQIYHAGGGARYWFRGGHGAMRALGLQGDARMNFRTGGIDFEDTMRTFPTFSLAVFIGL